MKKKFEFVIASALAILFLFAMVHLVEVLPSSPSSTPFFSNRPLIPKFTIEPFNELPKAEDLGIKSSPWNPVGTMMDKTVDKTLDGVNSKVIAPFNKKLTDEVGSYNAKIPSVPVPNAEAVSPILHLFLLIWLAGKFLRLIIRLGLIRGWLAPVRLAKI